MLRWVRAWLVLLTWLALVAFASAGKEAAGEEQLLRKAGIGTDARSLLEFFRRQTANESTAQRIRQSIAQLGSESFALREQGSKDLTAWGPLALPFLQQTLHTTNDLEVRRRARECVQQIQSRFPPALAAAAARLLALRQPPGSAEILLAFLPGPYDESVTEEIQASLITIARNSNEVKPTLQRYLASPIPAQRAAAAVTLCRLGPIDQLPAVRKLLRDDEVSVRLQVARELSIAGERSAVPVLVELLGQLPAEQAEQAEELLYRLAGPRAPLVTLGRDATTQLKCRDVWLTWWRENGEHVDMAALKDCERQLGYTLLVLLNDNRVIEWDRDGKLRWQITGLASPLDAEVLGGRRVLIAEHDTKRVTERTFKGEVLWEKKLTEPPIHAQRLPTGTTFIATRKQLMEVDRAGSEVIRYRSENNGIITARRFRDGRIGCIEKGSYFELNSAGVELRRFAAPAGVFTTNALTLLSNGHLLIAAYGGGTVQEFDRTGEVVWQIKLGRPLCALRLPGGNTLVSSQDMVLVEYDRTGKEISRREAPGHPCQIRRR